MTTKQKQIKDRLRLEHLLLYGRKRGVMPDSYNFNHTTKKVKPKKQKK